MCAAGVPCVVVKEWHQLVSWVGLLEWHELDVLQELCQLVCVALCLSGANLRHAFYFAGVATTCGVHCTLQEWHPTCGMHFCWKCGMSLWHMLQEMASCTMSKSTHDWVLFVVLQEMASCPSPRVTEFCLLCCRRWRHVQVHTWLSFVCCVAGDGVMHHVQVHAWLRFVCCVAGDGVVQHVQVHAWLRFVCCVVGDGVMHHVQVHSTQHDILLSAPLWTSGWCGCRRGMYHCMNCDNSKAGRAPTVLLSFFFWKLKILKSLL